MPCNCGCKAMLENIIQNKNVITASVDVSVKIQ